ncbi:MAG: DUF1583 domain-containing protein, partial [Planctomycetaceae bacterium]
RQQDVPPAEIYEALAAVVLPESRPAEAFLYARPLTGELIEHPRSVGRLLAGSAVRSGRDDDLRRRVEERRAQPLAALSSEILLTQLALAERDGERASELLGKLKERLVQDSLQHTATMACHVAVPALEGEATADAALPLLRQATDNLARGDTSDEEPLSTLVLLLARHEFRHGDAEHGRRALDQYLVVQQQQNVRYSGDSGLYRRKGQLKTVAFELIKAGQLDAALERLGEYGDIDVPQYARNESLSHVAAALHRELMQLPAEQRYEVLRTWTLPTEHRRTVRILTGFCSTKTPPPVFADAPFSVPSAGPVPGVMSTALLLIDAARETGHLDDLKTETQALVAANIENADALDLLIALSESDRDAASLAPRIEQIAAEIERNIPKQNDYDTALDLTAFTVACLCIEDKDLRPAAQKALRQLVTFAARISESAVRPYMRHAQAIAAAQQVPKLADAVFYDPGLALWRPVSHETADGHLYGGGPSVWIAQENHIVHWTGALDEYLYFRYPLAGSFDVELDAWDGGWSESHVAFGGLNYDVYGYSAGRGSVSELGRTGQLQAPSTSLRRNHFNRIHIEVRPERVRFSINGRLYHEDTSPSPATPWLALDTDRNRRSVWRNVRITGTPTIPRSVPLVQGDRLDGWLATYYSETRPTRIGPSQRQADQTSFLAVSATEQVQYDWHAENGVIHGRRNGLGRRLEPLESRLFYNRPLMSGETISYEFFYQPGEFEVHPALGRIAFLLRPDGVRLHWLTDGREVEWTGLAADNVVAIPEEQRSGDALPLKPGEWNRLVVSLEGSTARLELNGSIIYERPLDEQNGRLFSLYHDKNRSAVMVRNPVLTGDWPERLSGDQLANLTAHEHDAEPGIKRMRHRLMDEKQLSESAWSVYEQSARLPAEERYAALVAWVLPSDEHPTFRLYGDFTPTHPAPPVAAADIAGLPARSGV